MLDRFAVNPLEDRVRHGQQVAGVVERNKSVRTQASIECSRRGDRFRERLFDVFRVIARHAQRVRVAEAIDGVDDARVRKAPESLRR